MCADCSRAKEAQTATSDLCLDVLYNNNMKAFGLHELVLLYIKWKNENQSKTNDDPGEVTD